jgi:hypothetical protein
MTVTFSSSTPSAVDKIGIQQTLTRVLAGFSDNTPPRQLILAGLCACLPGGATASQIRFGLLAVGSEAVQAVVRDPRGGLYRRLHRAALSHTLASGPSSLPAAAAARKDAVASTARCLVGILAAPVDAKAVGVSLRMVAAARHVFAIIGCAQLDHLRETGKPGVLLTRGYVAALTNRSLDGAADILTGLAKLGWVRRVSTVNGGVGRYRISARLTAEQAEAAWLNADVVDALAVGGTALSTNTAAELIASASKPVWSYWAPLGGRAFTRALCGELELAEGDYLGLTKAGWKKLGGELLAALPGLGEPNLNLGLYLDDLGLRTLAVDLAEDRMVSLKEAAAIRTVALEERREDAKFANEIFRQVWKEIGWVPDAVLPRSEIQAWVGLAAAQLSPLISEPALRLLAQGLLRKDLIARGHGDSVARSIASYILPAATAAVVNQ